MGTKAKGLTRVPSAWVPDFVSLVPQTVAGAKLVDIEHAWREVAERLGRYETLLVRSDGPFEHARPGAGQTVTTHPDDLEETLGRARADPATLWPLIQASVEPSAVGALSNDRQVSPRRDVWVAEGPIANLHPQVVSLGRGRSDAVDDGRLCASADLRPTLRAVASYLSRLPGRYRVEWVWDGRVVWVVQADELADAVTDPRARRHLASRHRGHGLDPSPSQVCGWDGPKVQSRDTFLRLGLPTVPLFAQRADRLSGDARLRDWLMLVLDRQDDPIVLRTDISADTGSRLLLPTSAPSRDIEQLTSFGRRVVRSITGAGFPLHETALLASPLVPVVVSALAMLDESGAFVDIDSLWGFPDGLLHLPHDSSTVRGGQVEMRRRHKPACLMLSTPAERLEVRLGAPWDWGKTLREDEAQTIASWTRRITKVVGRNVQLMVLARVGGQRGSAGLLPFHYFEQPRSQAHRAALAPRGRAVVVQRAQDLQAPDDGEWIDLRPDLELTRDLRFLAAVADFAVRRGLPIAFSGSRLGHARYILEHHGATVFLAGGTPIETPTVPVIARTRSGLLRVMHLDPDTAAAALSLDIGESATDLAHPELLALAAQRQSHPSMPGVPWLSDAASATLGRRADRRGQVIGFGE